MRKRRKSDRLLQQGHGGLTFGLHPMAHFNLGGLKRREQGGAEIARKHQVPPAAIRLNPGSACDAINLALLA
jgi:hypothetical protein